MKEQIQYKPAVDRTLQSNRNKVRKSTSLKNFTHSTFPTIHTLQCAKAPDDIMILHNETNSLISKINSIDNNNTNPLNNYIKNSDIWANDTKMAAFRKFYEGYVALDLYINNINSVVKFAGSATEKPDVKQYTETNLHNYEIKHVSGRTDRLSGSIKDAIEQLTGREKNITKSKGLSTEDTCDSKHTRSQHITIYLSPEHLNNWYKKIGKKNERKKMKEKKGMDIVLESDDKKIWDEVWTEIKKEIGLQMNYVDKSYHLTLYNEFGLQHTEQGKLDKPHKGVGTRVRASILITNSK